MINNEPDSQENPLHDLPLERQLQLLAIRQLGLKVLGDAIDAHDKNPTPQGFERVKNAWLLVYVVSAITLNAEGSAELDINKLHYSPKAQEKLKNDTAFQELVNTCLIETTGKALTVLG